MPLCNLLERIVPENGFRQIQIASYMYLAVIHYSHFPGIPTVQFLITCSMQKWRGKPWSIYYVNDVDGGRVFV